MVPLLTSRAQRVTCAAVFAILSLVGFLPLFAGPGYEQALASGLVLPCAAAIATALDLVADARASPAACVRRGLGSGSLVGCVAFLTACLHGARAGFCDFWGGTTLFMLTAGFGAWLGGLWGVVTAEVIRALPTRRAGPAASRLRLIGCVLLAIAGPASGIAISLVRFYGSPMIFAYDPFFGYFSGTLYDTVVDSRAELWTYRAGSSATIVGVALVSAMLRRRDDGRLALVSWRGCAQNAACLALGLSALVLSAVNAACGSSLGHVQSAASIASALGGRASGPRCDVIYPDSVPPKDADVMLLDCEQEVAAVERRLATRLDGRLTVFEFADADQKRRLMGAAETSIAKPWRREVYVQIAAYPHPVLGHEIAHVVAGSFATGPFKVGGGWWPNPGVIEGLAVAASPDDDELTAAQWSRAMLDVGLLPHVREIFSADFLGQSAERSYTVAGAFVGWVMDRWGTEVLRAWYRGEPIERLTDQPWDMLEGAFRGWLGAQPLPSAAADYARSRFERPSVWRRKCPHVVDALDRAADRCRDEHKLERAARLYDSALERDASDWRALFGRSRLLVQQGHGEPGLAGLATIARDEKAPRTWRDRAEEAIADDAWLHGRQAEAQKAYRAIAGRTMNEDVARTLEVKAFGAGSVEGGGAIVDLLVDESGRAQDPWLGAVSTAEWADRTHDPLAEYLLGKNLLVHGEWERAALHLDRVLAGGAPTVRVGRETLRARIICACALGDVDALERGRAAVLAERSPFAEGTGGRRDWVLRFVDRCRAAAPG